MLDVDKFPLYWPEGWPRTKKRWLTYRYKVPFGKARDELVSALKRLGAAEIVVSTNIPIRGDGLPKAGIEPGDPGVAVYWMEGKAKRVIACDAWTKVRDNLRAVGLAVEGLCAVKRSGATQVLDRAFTGFTALAAENPKGRPWRMVFGWSADSISWTEYDVKQRFKELLLERHPDRGGSAEATHELTRARDEALAELRGEA